MKVLYQGIFNPSAHVLCNKEAVWYGEDDETLEQLIYNYCTDNNIDVYTDLENYECEIVEEEEEEA